MNVITVNKAQQLFVIPCGAGFTTAGFDYILSELKKIAAILNGKAVPKSGEKIVAINVDQAQRGTIEQYRQYQEACSLFGKFGIKETWYKESTPKAVRKILEQYRNSNDTIRVFLGNKETGRDWMGGNDVLGRVGRSTGIFKIPLLVEKGGCGGLALLDDCIVKLVDADTRKVLWQHPQYHLPDMKIVKIVDDVEFLKEGCTHAVQVEGETTARFRSYAKAAQFVAFMAGECMDQPQ